MNGFFGGIFDLDNNGRLDGFEQILDLAAFSQFMHDMDKDKSSCEEFDDSYDMDEDEIFDDF